MLKQYLTEVTAISAPYIFTHASCVSSVRIACSLSWQ